MAINHRCEKTHTSERELYLPYAIDVNTPILYSDRQLSVLRPVNQYGYIRAIYREKNLHVLRCGCGITPTFSRSISFSYMLYITGVTTPTLFQDSCEKHRYLPNIVTSARHGRGKTAIFIRMSDHTRKSRWNRKVHTSWISIKKKLCKLMAETSPPALVGLFYNPRSKQLEFFWSTFHESDHDE